MQAGLDGYADIDGGRLWYELAGQGETLVLAHAGFLDSGMWDDQWAAFTQDYRVLRFDMRGYGKSSRIDAPVSRRDDLYKLLTGLGIDRAALLGCSLGGAMMLDFALEHPDMVSVLIPYSTAPGGFELQGEPPPYMMDMIAAMQGGDVEKASELQLRIWVDGMQRQPEQVRPDVRRRAAAMNRIAIENGTLFADMQPANPLVPPVVTRLGDIQAPVLVVAGALDHPEILRAADVMVEGITGAQKAIIPGGGHVVNMDNPAAFNQAVLTFLHDVL